MLCGSGMLLEHMTEQMASVLGPFIECSSQNNKKRHALARVLFESAHVPITSRTKFSTTR